MFTGIITHQGVLTQRHVKDHHEQSLSIECTWDSALSLGESIAVNGVCLTVRHIAEKGFEADISNETCKRTTLGELVMGQRLHLERAATPQSRLGGHFVTGHIDGVGSLLHKKQQGEAWQFRYLIPAELMPAIAPKGSIAIDGVSLTPNYIDIEHTHLDVTLLPHTLSHTQLGTHTAGTRVNLETDILAKYVLQCMHYSKPSIAKSGSQAI